MGVGISGSRLAGNVAKLVAVGTMDELRSGEKGGSLEQVFFELTEKKEGP